MVFSSGKLVCTGTKSVALAQSATDKFARMINEAGFPIEIHNFAVQNIVAAVDLKVPIDLNRFVELYPEGSNVR